MPQDRLDDACEVPRAGIGNPYPDPLMERLLRRTAPLWRKYPPEEAKARELTLLVQLTRQPEVDLSELDGVDRGQELVFRAWETDDPARTHTLLEEALSIDPRNPDALTSLAFAERRRPEKLIAGLKRAVRAGEAALGTDFFEEHRGRFWNTVETRPYVRARLALARQLLALGRSAEALEHGIALLDLGSDDIPGARYTAVGAALELGDLDRALEVMRRFPDEASALFLWARALMHYVQGEAAEAKEVVAQARAENRFVEEMILEPESRALDMPSSFIPGGVREAEFIAFTLGAAWDRSEEAIERLDDDRRVRAEAEVQAAIERLEERMGEEAPDWFPGLFLEEEFVPDILVDEVEANGPDAVPWLLAVIEDDDLLDAPDPGVISAPENAAAVAAYLDILPEKAVPRLAARLLELGRARRSSPEALIDVVASFGPPAIEPILSLLDDDDAPPFTVVYLEEALAYAGQGDERAFARILEVLEKDASEGARLLAIYDDPRAISPLRAALSRVLDDPGTSGDEAEAIRALARVIELLGGTLTAAEAARARKVLRGLEGDVVWGPAPTADATAASSEEIWNRGLKNILCA